VIGSLRSNNKGSAIPGFEWYPGVSALLWHELQQGGPPNLQALRQVCCSFPSAPNLVVRDALLHNQDKTLLSNVNLPLEMQSLKMNFQVVNELMQ
jgi:hypothetical protein